MLIKGGGNKVANINLIDALKELTSEKNNPMDVLIKAIKEAAEKYNKL